MAALVGARHARIKALAGPCSFETSETVLNLSGPSTDLLLFAGKLVCSLDRGSCAAVTGGLEATEHNRSSFLAEIARVSGHFSYAEVPVSPRIAHALQYSAVRGSTWLSTMKTESIEIFIHRESVSEVVIGGEAFAVGSVLHSINRWISTMLLRLTKPRVSPYIAPRLAQDAAFLCGDGETASPLSTHSVIAVPRSSFSDVSESVLNALKHTTSPRKVPALGGATALSRVPCHCKYISVTVCKAALSIAPGWYSHKEFVGEVVKGPLVSYGPLEYILPNPTETTVQLLDGGGTRCGTCVDGVQSLHVEKARATVLLTGCEADLVISFMDVATGPAAAVGQPEVEQRQWIAGQGPLLVRGEVLEGVVVLGRAVEGGSIIQVAGRECVDVVQRALEFVGQTAQE